MRRGKRAADVNRPRPEVPGSNIAGPIAAQRLVEALASHLLPCTILVTGRANCKTQIASPSRCQRN
jgi:hypothetical protein